MHNADESEVIREMVRGERPWSDLPSLDIVVHMERNTFSADNPRKIEVRIHSRDVAQGLLRLRNDRRDLRRWAWIILAADFVDLALEEEPDGDILLDALWDASFGEPVSEEAFATVERLVAEQSGSL